MAEDESIRVMIARIDERTKNMDDKLDKHLSDDAAKHKDFEDRIRVIESWKSRVLGIVFAIVTIGGFVVGMARDALAAMLHLPK